jgi:hypothetical protein
MWLQDALPNSRIFLKFLEGYRRLYEAFRFSSRV